MFNPFKMPGPADITKRQLEEASRMALEHEAAAELHASMAAMYRARIERLQAQQNTDLPINLKTGLRTAA